MWDIKLSISFGNSVPSPWSLNWICSKFVRSYAHYFLRLPFDHINTFRESFIQEPHLSLLIHFWGFNGAFPNRSYRKVFVRAIILSGNSLRSQFCLVYHSHDNIRSMPQPMTDVFVLNPQWKRVPSDISASHNLYPNLTGLPFIYCLSLYRPKYRTII